MKWITNIYVVALSILLFSCYEDKGNYDYKDVNAFTITGFNGVISTSQFYSCSVDDIIELKAGVEFEKTQENDMAYEWFGDDELISTDSILNFPAKELKNVRNKETRSFIKLRLTSKRTGFVTQQGINVDVEPFTLRGFAVLTQKENGDNQLHFLKNTWEYSADNSSVTNWKGYQKSENIYEAVNNEPLGKNITGLQVHYSDMMTLGGNIIAISPEIPYNIDIDGNSFRKECYTKDFFLGNAIPKGFAPVNEFALRMSSFIVDRNGSVYMRQKNNGNDLQSGSYSTEPFYVEDGMNIVRSFSIPAPNQMFSLLYDAKQQRVLLVTSGGKISEVPKTQNSKPVVLPEGFPDLSNLQGEILYGGKDSKRITLLYKGATEFKLLKFEFAIYDSWGGGMGTNSNKDYEVFSLERDKFHPDSEFEQPNRMTNYFFYSGGSENKVLYLYDCIAQRSVEYCTFNAPIVKLCCEDIKKSNPTIAVGLESGEIKIVDIRADAHHEDNKDKRVLETVNLSTYGKIIDIEKKSGFGHEAS